MSSIIEEIKDLDLDPYSTYMDEEMENGFSILEKFEKLSRSCKALTFSELEFTGITSKEAAECFEPTEIEVRMNDDEFPISVNGAALKFDEGCCYVLVSDTHTIKVWLDENGRIGTVYVATDISMFNTKFVMKVLRFEGYHLDRVTYWTCEGPAIEVHYEGTRIYSIKIIDKKIMRSLFDCNSNLLGYYRGGKLYTYIQPPIELGVNRIVQHKEDTSLADKQLKELMEDLEKRSYL